MMVPGQIFIFSAPSGGGKSTIIRGLREEIGGLGYAVSHTSRAPRRTEREGCDYFFVSRDTFEQMIGQGAFVEWAKVYGDFYGTSFMTLEEQTGQGFDVVMDVDAQGALNIKRHFPFSVLIYVLPPSLGVLAERLRDRGTDPEEAIQRRLGASLDEVRHCLEYDYILINDRLEEVMAEAQAVIRAARCSASRREQRVRQAFPECFGS